MTDYPAGGGRAVAILSMAYCLAFVDRQILSLLVEPIKRDLHISDTQMSLLTGVSFALFYCVAALPAGWLADRGNRRNLIAAGVGLWSAMTAMSGLAQNFLQLLFARTGVGLGEATLSPSVYSLLGDYFPPKQLPAAMGVFMLGAPFGSALALVLGGSLLGLVARFPPVSIGLLRLEPWQVTLGLIGAFGLLIVALLTTIAEPLRRTQSTSGDALAGRRMRDALAFARDRKMLFLLLLMGMGLSNMCSFGYMAWAPSVFIRRFAWDLPTTGLRLGIVLAVFGCAGSLSSGWLATAFARRGRVDGSLLGMIVAVSLLFPASVLLPLAPSAWAALALAAPVFFGIFLCASLFPSTLQLVTPAGIRGQVGAACLLVANLTGLGFGPSLYALVTEHIFGGPQFLGASLTTVSAALCLGSILSYVLALPFYRAGLMRVAGRLSDPAPAQPL